MTARNNFEEKICSAFKAIIKETEKGSSELDVRYKFVKYFLEKALGYEPKYIKWEKKRADLTVIDENDFAVLKIETKRPTESIDKKEHEEQAFKYLEETTRYIGLTNFHDFKLWEVKEQLTELMVHLDFSVLASKKPTDLSGEEKSQLLFLNNLTKETLFDPSKYENFNETYARIDITREEGFNKLLDRLNFITHNLLLGYTLKAFGEYKEGYDKYQAELDKVEKEFKNNKGNRDLSYGLARYKQKIEEKYGKYRTFSGFELWKQYSGKEDKSEDEIREVFCKETIYVLLNKLLFIRICEDKELIEKNISNQGIEQLRGFLKNRVNEDDVNKEILEFAYRSAKNLYPHFYEIGILDWFRSGDGELNELLNRILWILNQFDFTHVDRDILGNLYEKYLPPKERKRLGEFYTPVEVIDYILTSVGYSYNDDIETKDLLDPACGSGGFLVRASRRLISRYLIKFDKTDKKELKNPKKWKGILSRLSPDEAKIILDAIQERIYGLDINPFACHIAEMNILIQIIDLYQKTKEKYKDYKIERFRIYRTDSLDKTPPQRQIWDDAHAAFMKEQEEVDTIKYKKFDFVVGNPPYVRVQHLSKADKNNYAKNYITAEKSYDIYVLFFERGLQWLKENGKLGFICSNRFATVNYGEKLREYILENAVIEEFVDFKDTGVFKDALNYPSIIILKKQHLEDYFVRVCLLNRKDQSLSEEDLAYMIKRDIKKVKNIKDNVKNDYYDTFAVPVESLSQEGFYFVSHNQQQLLKKLSDAELKLKDISATKKKDSAIFEGSSTGLKDIFVVKLIKRDELFSTIKCPSNGKEYKIDTEILKPYVEDAGKWLPAYKNLVLIFPYQKKDGKYSLLEENVLKDGFSLCWQYLDEHKQILKNRKSLKNANWYAYSAPRSLDSYGMIKLLIQGFSIQSCVSIDNQGDIFFGPDIYGLPIKDEYKEWTKLFMAILNSNITNFYIRQVGVIHESGYYKYEDRFIKNIPIILPGTPDKKKTADKITKKTNEILNLYKEEIADVGVLIEGQKTDKLCNIQKVSFHVRENAELENITTKGNKIYINSKDFLEIKDKKIKDYVVTYLATKSEVLSKSKNSKNLIMKIPVPEDKELLKNIAKKGISDKESNNKISNLEEEINELVYKLYGINEKEKKIIEENI